MKRVDRYILLRLLATTLLVLLFLIAIFILIDFSERSDDFADRGAPLERIWNEYYMNYIPEMARLVMPLAVFVACLYLTGQMTERLEIVALKASGVSLYRLAAPFLLFGFATALLVAALDAWVIPESNAERFRFEQEVLGGTSEMIDRGSLYRQESEDRIFRLNHFNPNANTGYRLTLVQFNSNHEIESISEATRIDWVDSLGSWKATRFRERLYDQEGFRDTTHTEAILDLNILPRDLARRSSDIYQLTWPEAHNYIESLRRVGAAEIDLPLVQFYGRVAYPFSILVVTLIGFALASQRRKGGKGFYVASGLAISFLYLALMKIMEPFGAAGTLSPVSAAVSPHIFFLLAGLFLLLTARK